MHVRHHAERHVFDHRVRRNVVVESEGWRTESASGETGKIVIAAGFAKPRG
jgi:hypothetical protein